MGGFVLVQGATAIPVELKLPDEGTDLVLMMQGQPVKAGGQIGGRLEVLTKDLRTIEAQLDDVAKAVAQSVNAVHRAGYYAEGESGQSFFAGDPTGRITAASLRLEPSLTVDRLAVAVVGEPGSGEATTFSPLNGENALKLADLRQAGIGLAQMVGGKEITVTSTPAEWLNRVTSTLASGASAALATAETTGISVTSLRAQRESSNGVSIDEEMVELVKFQHSYDAAARVISIADEMLNTLINGMGAGR
jgi:flagellar hook-associated protein 1 FlgK